MELALQAGDMESIDLSQYLEASRGHAYVTADFDADHDLAKHALADEVKEGARAEAFDFSRRYEQDLK